MSRAPIVRMSSARTPRLSQEDEYALVRRYQAKDPTAGNAIVRAFDPLVWAVARSFLGRSMDDVMQDGRVGLLAGAKRFDFSVRLSTYAPWHIRKSIHEGLKLDRLVWLPHRKYEAMVKAGGADYATVSDEGLAADSPTPADLYESAEARSEVAQCMEVLSMRERYVFERRVLEEELLGVVGERLGVSVERVRQIEMKALEKVAKRARMRARAA